jgi:hypothetical protein
MSTDDRDIESSNPSKNFKVGDFDQLSGFFTPVWESKRRIRSEPPAPPSPSSQGNSNRATPSSRSAAQPAGAAATDPSAPDAQLHADEAQTVSSSGVSSSGVSPSGSVIPRPRSSPPSNKSPSRSTSVRGATPVPPAPSSERASAAPGSLLAELAPAVAAVFNAPVAEAEGSLLGRAASPPVRPEAAAGEPQPPAAQSASPSAAARALRAAGPDLPPAAFLDQEPDFRSPRGEAPRPAPRTDDRPGARQRALRAATRAHEQLKAKLQQEAAELEESRFELDPETNRDPLEGLESNEYDPYPLSLMRRMRRTIRLSAPVPDPIRSLIAKYDRG